MKRELTLVRDLIIVRGVSGSGKTTFAELISPSVFSADDFFMNNGKYEFDVNKLGQAHQWCQLAVETRMKADFEKIVVANTFTRVREMKPYLDLAEKYGYRVFTIIVENRHGGVNVHEVPAEILIKQKERFDIKL